MESKSKFFSILKSILIMTLAISAISILILFGAYAFEAYAYIEANTSNTGIITDKSIETPESSVSTRYAITIERQTANSAGEVQTKSETYSVSYDEWLQIEEGYVATYQKDGSIDIVPPTEGVPNTGDTGIVTNKSCATDGNQLAAKYTVTIQRQSFNLAGEATTKSKTYTIPYEDWLEVSVGDIATYCDGSIDINPPIEGEAQPELQPPEPFGLSFPEYIQETAPVDATTLVVIILLAFLGLILIKVFNNRGNPSSEETGASAARDKYPRPYVNDEEDPDPENDEAWDDETDDDDDYWADEELVRSDGRVVRTYSAMFAGDHDAPHKQFVEAEPYMHNQIYRKYEQEEAPNPQQSTQNPPQPNRNQEPRLTVRLIRSHTDSLTQIEIVENYRVLASGYNSSLTTDYDDRPVTKLSISSSFSPKLTLDITPKTF